MRDTHRCPKCAHHEILYLPQLTDTNHDVLAVAIVETKATGERTECGQFEAYICRRCGFTEFHARQASLIPTDDIAGAKVLVGIPTRPYR